MYDTNFLLMLPIQDHLRLASYCFMFLAQVIVFPYHKKLIIYQQPHPMVRVLVGYLITTYFLDSLVYENSQ